MTPEEMDKSIRVSIDHADGLSQEQAQYLLARYDEAVENQNANARSLVDAGRICRESRHVTELFMSVMQILADERQQAGLKHLIQALEGKYSWLIAHRGPEK